MVMEYLEGSDLSCVLRDKGPLPLRDAVEYVLEACSAVAEAHSLGIIHRDLKPSNLFLATRAGGQPVVKVLDFGISKFIPTRDSSADFDPSTTRTSAWLGSPLYMSPEQMTSAKKVDLRTDIWSLGAILFELITGQPPFNAATLPELFAAILHSPPAPFESLRPDAPPELGAVVRKALAKNLVDRYASVAELATALVPFGPRRARTAAERAVAVSEAAGITVRTARRPLDATLPEDTLTPMRSPIARLSEPGQPVDQRDSNLGGPLARITPYPVSDRGAASSASAPSTTKPRSPVIPIVAVLVTLGAATGGALFVRSRLRGEPPIAVDANHTPVAPATASASSSPSAPSATPAVSTPLAAPSAPSPSSSVADAGAASDAGSRAKLDAGSPARDAGAAKAARTTPRDGDKPTPSASPALPAAVPVDKPAPTSAPPPPPPADKPPPPPPSPPTMPGTLD
jgi:serine/threonine-protein kinase